MAVELHVDDGADHLGHAALLAALGLVAHGRAGHRLSVVHGQLLRQSASAPEMISISSLVIVAWRVRL